MPMKRNRLTGSVMLGVLALTSACGGIGQDSAWREPEADGSVSWADVPFHREGGLEVGFANDDGNLWVCLYSSDPAVQMVLLRQGATVWAGDHGFRITRRSDVAPGDGRPGRDGSAPADTLRPDGPPDPEAMLAQVRSAPRDLEILSRDGDVTGVRSPGEAEPTDIRVETADTAYYVLRIPLQQDSVALGAGPGESVRIRVETPEYVMPEFLARRLADRRRGGGGGFVGAARSSGRRRGPDLDPPDPVSVEFSVRLAGSGS
jgi:hypothetical protein